MASTGQKRTYGQVCRAFIERISEREEISKVTLARKMRVHLQTLMTLAYHGRLDFEKAVAFAHRAGATVSELGALEGAWFQERARKDSRGATRRLLELVEVHRSMHDMLNEFMERHGLLDEFHRTHPRWDHNNGLMDPAAARVLRMAGRRGAAKLKRQ